MHDPISLDPLGRPATVEHERLLHPNLLCPAGGQDRLVRAGGLPVARRRRPVRPGPVRILPVPRTEEVPFLLAEGSFPCSSTP